MCCLFASLLMFGPRFAIIVWWLMNPARWGAAFTSFLPGLLGFVFLPWTTLAYVAVGPGVISQVGWIIVAVAFLFDVGSYTSSEWGWRRQHGVA